MHCLVLSLKINDQGERICDYHTYGKQIDRLVMLHAQAHMRADVRAKHVLRLLVLC